MANLVPADDLPSNIVPAHDLPDQAQPSSILERVGTGLGDMAWGAGQLASHVVPGIDSGIVDQMAKDRETEYEAKRKAAGSTGVDWARMAGNVANPINYVGGAALAPATLAGRVALGAGAGAVAGALQPATGKDGYWGQKAMQTAAGAATGGALPVAGAAASRIINPQTAPEIKRLADQGITPTLWQSLGPTTKSLEEKLSSHPIVGPIVQMGKQGQVNDLNRSLYNMALEPIGEQSTAKIGREGVAEVYKKLGDAYGGALQGKTVNLDGGFQNDLDNLWTATKIMPVSVRRQYNNIKELFLPPTLSNTSMTGEEMKALDSQIGGISRQYSGARDPNERMLGDAFSIMQDKLREAVSRSNPNLSAALKPIDEGYATFTRIRNAAARTGAKEGIITPGVLDASVRQMDKTVGKGGTAMGGGFMRQYADDVQKVMGGTYPDSGTAGRTLMNVLLQGGGMLLNPGHTLLAAGLAAPSILRKPIAAAMTSRPWQAPIAAEAVQNAAQYLAPGAAQVAGRVVGQ